MTSLIAQALVAPERVVGMTLAEWDTLIPQGVNTSLLASLWSAIERSGLSEEVPPAVKRHLVSEFRVFEKQRRGLVYEVKWLLKALGEIDERLILLKGAAYSAAGLEAADGRLMTDIDLLVPEEKLAAVEDILREYGWSPGPIHPYDDRYFRTWMHEIPALGHDSRESTLDVHHTILPPTADADLEPSSLFDAALEVRPNVFVLASEDMVIHSAAHLFHEGEFDSGLRSLFDLDRLIREFSRRDGDFWEKLCSRAVDLDLANSLHHALRQVQIVFATPVPHSVLQKLMPSVRKPYLIPVMDFLLRRAFVPDHESCRLSWTNVSLFLLYVRGHYLRMPFYLLVPHLLRKAWMRRFAGDADDITDAKA